MNTNSDFFDWLARVWVDYRPVFNVVFVLVGALVLRAILLSSVKRVVVSVTSGVDAKTKPTADDSPLAKARVVQRARTIGSVLSNFITWGITVVAIIMCLGELGVAVGGLIAGAGIIGAAIGFGAQSLVRDLISGLFLVFEDQLGVGDAVDVGEVKGIVEAVGLRVTQVRDIEGTLWYVRNGEIQRVGNKSQGWSRILLDVALDSASDLTKAQKVIGDTAVAVSKSSAHSKSVIGAPEVWGVQTFSGDEVVIRLVQQVDPKAQDELARELRAALIAALGKSKISLASNSQSVFVKLGK
jgi:small-conductance mechanosensitive channel